MEKLAETLKKRNKKTDKTNLKKEFKNSKLIEGEQKTGNFLTSLSFQKESQTKENKFIESGIVLEKSSPVLKPVAKAQEGLEQISSSFVLQRKQENQTIEKPYEFGEQKYFSKSGEYKTIEKIKTENLQTPSGAGREMVHMGIEQATKIKSEKFFDEKQERKYSADIKSLKEVKEKRKNNFYTPR